VIGYRPYLLTGVAVVLLAVVALDVGGLGIAVLAGSAHGVHHGLRTLTRALARPSLLDWILIALAILLPAWAWLRVLALARLGSIEISDLALGSAEIADLGGTGTSQASALLKAALQEELGGRGLRAASGLPGGAPSVASLAAAVAQVPIGQVNWVAGLIALVPTPPTSTSFRITGTLRTRPLDAGRTEVGLSYELARLGPRPAVRLGDVWAVDRPTLLARAARDIFRNIVDHAPAIYPDWVRWSSSDALVGYRNGLALEQHAPGPSADPAAGQTAATERFAAAYACYRKASELDPDNMLVRLRAANCLERIAAGLGTGPARVTREIEALQAYVSIRLRQPTIFQAGFRGSVLLSSLAHEVPTLGVTDDQRAALAAVLGRLDAEATGSHSASRRAAAKLRRIEPRPRPAAGTQTPDVLLGRRLDAAAGRESRLARHRLRPLWTIVHEKRFRHRFEPTGQARRQLRKALGVSQMCLRARRARRPRHGRRPISRLGQRVWRCWVFWRFFAVRSRVAGWQAHYNAACFYALLPRAAEPAGSGPARVRRRALWHLAVATDYADRDLSCVYVRDEDPDLQVLRRLCKEDFELVVRRICPEEVVVHYGRPAHAGWGLHVWGEATAANTRRPRGDPLPPSASTPAEAIYRIRIFDENKLLEFLAHSGEEEDETRWRLIPAEHGSNVWVYPGDPRIHAGPRAEAPAPAAGQVLAGS
jgi:Bacterial pullanase-associated domain